MGATDESAVAITGRGRCACGAITYRTTAPLRPVINCHCDRCRRVTGHFLAATSVARSALHVEDTDAHLRWWEAAPGVRYGFCDRCGSTVFWAVDDRDRVSIAAGTLDPPTGLRTTDAWYVAHASDYHTLDRSLTEHDTE